MVFSDLHQRFGSGPVPPPLRPGGPARARPRRGARPPLRIRENDEKTKQRVVSGQVLRRAQLETRQGVNPLLFTSPPLLEFSVSFPHYLFDVSLRSRHGPLSGPALAKLRSLERDSYKGHGFASGVAEECTQMHSTHLRRSFLRGRGGDAKEPQRCPNPPARRNLPPVSRHRREQPLHRRLVMCFAPSPPRQGPSSLPPLLPTSVNARFLLSRELSSRENFSGGKFPFSGRWKISRSIRNSDDCWDFQASGRDIRTRYGTASGLGTEVRARP